MLYRPLRESTAMVAPLDFAATAPVPNDVRAQVVLPWTDSVKRKSLTPTLDATDPGLPPTRRAGGARHELSDRVQLFQDDRELSGWALNMSRGGLRAIVEDPIDLGGIYELIIGDGPRRRCQVVWVQQEPDGAIVGLSFLDVPVPAEP